jgi:cytochrome P450
MEACRRRYGDVVMFRTAENATCVIVFDSQLMKQMLRRTHDEVRIGDAQAQLLLAAGSVIGLEDAEHRERRRMLAPPFQGERMSAHTRLIRDVTHRVVDSWPTGEEFALLPSLRSLTFEVIAGVVLGPENGSPQDELTRRFRALTHPGRPRPRRVGRSAPWYGGRLLVDEFLRDEIARRRAAPDGHDDLLSRLLLARDRDGQPIADQELCNNLVLLLFAGSETTAIGLAWAFELLLRHPATLERLEGELADGDECYLKAVVRETLRLHPPAPFVRRVVRDEPYALGGHLILPGTEIRASIVTIHRRADHYPDPLVFRPERHLSPNPAGEAPWLPFGVGPHRCLGASFATFEMENIIRRVLERTRLRLAGRRPERATIGGTAAPARGVRVIRESRMTRNALLSASASYTEP